MKKQFVYYLVIAICVVSCQSYEYMYYDVLRPASYSVPPQIKSIVIVDNAYPFNADDAHIAHVVGEEVRLDTVRVDTFTTILIKQLKEEMDLRRFFDTIYVDDVKYNQEGTGQPLRSLTQAQVIDICNKYNADAVLSLVGARYGTEVKVHDMDVEFYSTMDVSGLTYWRLFDGYSYEAIYATSYRDTLYWDGVGGEINASLGNFPSLHEATLELGQFMGATFADNLTPRWEPVSRKIYIAGNPQFVNAADWLSKSNRYEAEKLWGFVYEHGNSREKGKAANNIATSLEARGELKLAMEWAHKSYQAFGMSGVTGNTDERKTAKALYVDLVRRYRDQKKLDEQVGPVQ